MANDIKCPKCGSDYIRWNAALDVFSDDFKMCGCEDCGEQFNPGEEEKIVKYGRVKPRFFGVWHIMKGDKFLCGKDEQPNEFLDVLDGKRVCKKCQHVEAGYIVETIRAGQTRNYGPTINTYRVEDLNGRARDEVFDYCREFIKFGYKREEDGFHSLTSHVMQFVNEGDSKYLYEVGHEYTG